MKSNIIKIIIINILLLIIFLIIIAFVKNPRKPNIVYMPDMYYSKSYKHYNKNESDNKILPLIKNKTSRGGGESLYAVNNTIPRNQEGYLPYQLNNSFNDYEKSKIKNKSPLNKINKKQNLSIGKHLYEINCAICHGLKGDGLGFLSRNEKINGIPNYKNRNITIPSVYHVITYGKNTMGSYSEQLNEIDRWRVSEYVLELKKILQ